MVLVFHRQWLNLSDSPQPTNPTGWKHVLVVCLGGVWLCRCDVVPMVRARAPAGVVAPAPWWLRPAASLLREALLLLHWLLLHHSSFSESCRPLLHMYDQVVPAVQDLLRRVPERSESEGERVHVHHLPPPDLHPFMSDSRKLAISLPTAVLDVNSLCVRCGSGGDLPLGGGRSRRRPQRSCLLIGSYL